jgi:hypothetical protein
VWEGAVREAVAAGHDYVGTAHLFVAAAAALPPGSGLGVDAAAARVALGQAAVHASPTAGPPVPTPRLKRAVGRAIERAAAGGRSVGWQDLWHAMLADPGAECAAVLERLGVRAEDLLAALV